MKRKEPATTVAAQVDRSPKQEQGDDQQPLARTESVFRSDHGLIFGNTSLIDDALLREAIAGRFSL